MATLHKKTAEGKSEPLFFLNEERVFWSKKKIITPKIHTHSQRVDKHNAFSFFFLQCKIFVVFYELSFVLSSSSKQQFPGIS